jgi:hypothetical protein
MHQVIARIVNNLTIAQTLEPAFEEYYHNATKNQLSQMLELYSFKAYSSNAPSAEIINKITDLHKVIIGENNRGICQALIFSRNIVLLTHSYIKSHLEYIARTQKEDIYLEFSQSISDFELVAKDLIDLSNKIIFGEVSEEQAQLNHLYLTGTLIANCENNKLLDIINNAKALNETQALLFKLINKVN